MGRTGRHYIKSYIRMHLSPCTQMCGCQPDSKPAATTALQEHDYRFEVSSMNTAHTCFQDIVLYTFRSEPSVPIYNENTVVLSGLGCLCARVYVCVLASSWMWEEMLEVRLIDMKDFFTPCGLHRHTSVRRMRKMKHCRRR